MTTITTYHDIEDGVVRWLGDRVSEYDVDAITAELIATFPLTGPDPTETLATIAGDWLDFGRIVNKHKRVQKE